MARSDNGKKRPNLSETTTQILRNWLMAVRDCFVLAAASLPPLTLV